MGQNQSAHSCLAGQRSRLLCSQMPELPGQIRFFFPDGSVLMHPQAIGVSVVPWISNTTQPVAAMERRKL